MKIEHISFGYRKKQTVLHDVSFELRPGITILLGENGSGKTTLIKNMLGILKPRSGSITLDGCTPVDTDFSSKVSYLPQDFSIYPYMKVQDILQFVAAEKKISMEAQIAAVQEVADKTNITAYLKSKFKACSLGTQKRVGIAAALLGNTPFTVLDEPTAGIDPRERMAFYEVIRNAFADRRLLLSTHILDDMESLADNVLMLSKGKIVFHGSYRTYCSLLNCKLYELCCQIRPEWLKEYRILSEHRDGTGIVYHFVAEETPTEGTPVKASTEDIWTYLTGDSL